MVVEFFEVVVGSCRLFLLLETTVQTIDPSKRAHAQTLFSSVGAEKVGLRQDTELFLKRFVLTKVPRQSRYNETFVKA